MSHAAFIAAAYGAAAVILALLIAWIVFDYRALRRALARFEEAGVTRRSAGGPDGTLSAKAP